MNKLFAVIAVAALLAGCASTPTTETKAAVEDRTPTKSVPAQPAAPGVARVAPPAPRTAQLPNALKDPNNILSKRSLYYDYDKYDVKDEYKAMVQAHAQYLRGNPRAKMLIQGNTDERGSREYNLALGQRRADAMKKMLLLLGAKEEQIESVSLGEEKPRAQGSTEEAYAQNRRGDILYSGE